MPNWLKNYLLPTIASALTALVVAGAANGAMWQWSKTASSNSNADPTINWAEGMSPSSVNDSARAMMARVADWRDDISGTVTTTGTGTALAMTSNQGFDTTAHMNGAMLAFVPNVTNTGAVTLAVDGLTAKPIRSSTGSGGNLGAGVLVQGTPYVVTYNDSVGEFVLQGFVGNPFAVPLGSFMFHSVATVPNSNFVMPIGQAISRTTYAAYFAMVGTTFGAGDGVTTFNVPDLRSRIPVPLATMGGADPGRVTTAGSGLDGATLGAVGGQQNTTLLTANLPAYTPAGTVNIVDPGHSHQTVKAGSSDGTSVSATRQVYETINSGSDFSYALRSTAAGATADIGPSSTNTTGISATFAGTAQGGTSTPVSRMPPAIVLPILLRIL